MSQKSGDRPDGDLDAGFLARLGEAVATLGGPTLAARACDVSRSTLDLWLRGKSRIPLAAASRLASGSGQSLDWLVSGEARLPSMRQVMTTDATLPEGFVPVPMLEVRASAGPGLVPVPQPPPQEVLSLRGDWLRQLGLAPGRAEAMFVTGDSMDPTIKDGDLILVDRQIDRVIDGGIYVLVVSGEVRVKRIFTRTDGSMVLKSENEVWPEEVVPHSKVNDLIIVGRVRWFGRML